jgi:hypothetical protein
MHSALREVHSPDPLLGQDLQATDGYEIQHLFFGIFADSAVPIDGIWVEPDDFRVKR